MNPVVLAIDPSRKGCGLATPSNQIGVPRLRTVSFDEGPRPFVFAEFRGLLEREIRKGITHIAIEGPIPIAAMRGTKEGKFSFMTTEDTYRMMRGMIGVAEEIAGSLLAGRYLEFPIQKIKSNFTGDARARKEAMIRRCQLLGWSCIDSNQADAAAIWTLAMATLEPRWSPHQFNFFESYKLLPRPR